METPGSFKFLWILPNQFSDILALYSSSLFQSSQCAQGSLLIVPYVIQVNEDGLALCKASILITYTVLPASKYIKIQ